MGRRAARHGVTLVAVVLAMGACTSAASTDDQSAAAAPTTQASPSGGSPTSGEDGPTTARPGAPTGELPEGRDVVVTSITDGDTFRAGEERVRLTGIDTPEVSGGVECYGREATDALATLIPEGSEVRLVTDVEAEDRYDRTLAYVYRLSDGAFVNLAMARDGFAQPLTIPPNVAHEDDFATAAGEAREAERGLWSACAGDLDPDTAPSTTSASPGSAGAGGGACDPAYPDGCIPSAPPDLDCGDIPDRDFTVLPPDPHGFDGGGDGRGCEGS